jgi:hypothetical protein
VWLLPFADVLYANDAWWWKYYDDQLRSFAGERWSSHGVRIDEKLEIGEKYGVRLVQGRRVCGFSFEPSVIHYGANSGFQGINMALHLTSGPIALVGFDMRTCAKRHFCGPHPVKGRNAAKYEQFIPEFNVAAKLLGRRREIINCTSGSALKCFRMAKLEDVL